MKIVTKNPLNLIIISLVLLVTGLACSNKGNSANTGEKKASDTKSAKSGRSAKLDSYTIKGIKFAYYKIDSGLSKDELIAAAQKLHESEPDTQLILVDDDSELANYIKYVKAISGQGEIEGPMPAEWADKHIIANVQKYMSGKFVLCKGNGSGEIADLK